MRLVPPIGFLFIITQQFKSHKFPSSNPLLYINPLQKTKLEIIQPYQYPKNKARKIPSLLCPAKTHRNKNHPALMMRISRLTVLH